MKQGTIEMKKGTLENKFIITDFKNELSILYKGPLPATFREGDMATVGGFLADVKNPTCFIATSVQANHEIAPDRWLGETNLDKAISINMIETNEDFEYTKMKWNDFISCNLKNDWNKFVPFIFLSLIAC